MKRSKSSKETIVVVARMREIRCVGTVIITITIAVTITATMTITITITIVIIIAAEEMREFARPQRTFGHF